jgi:hypothetical protein
MFAAKAALGDGVERNSRADSKPANKTGTATRPAELFFFLHNFLCNCGFARGRRRHQITDQIIQFIRAKN